MGTVAKKSYWKKVTNSEVVRLCWEAINKLKNHLADPSLQFVSKIPAVPHSYFCKATHEVINRTITWLKITPKVFESYKSKVAQKMEKSIVSGVAASIIKGTSALAGIRKGINKGIGKTLGELSAEGLLGKPQFFPQLAGCFGIILNALAQDFWFRNCSPIWLVIEGVVSVASMRYVSLHQKSAQHKEIH